MRVFKLASAVLAIGSVFVTGVARAGGEPSAGGSPLNLPLDGNVTSPDWRRPPSGDDLAREYPPLAQFLDMPGGATVGCEVETDGRLEDCHVLSEWPLGLGFGAAAVRTSKYMVMKPATRDGKPIVGDVTVPLHFQLAQPDAQQSQSELPSTPTSPGALAAAREIVLRQDLANRLRAAWRANIDRLAAQAVFTGQGESSTAALDALRQGLDEAIAFKLERQAQILASQMTEADLRATSAYMATPAGRAWLMVDAGATQASDKTFMVVLVEATRKHLCAQTNCDGPDPKPPARGASR